MKTFEEWYEESGEFLTQHEIGMTDLMEASYLAGQKSMDDMVIEYESGCSWWTVFKPVEGCSHAVLKDGFKSREEAEKWVKLVKGE